MSRTLSWSGACLLAGLGLVLVERANSRPPPEPDCSTGDFNWVHGAQSPDIVLTTPSPSPCRARQTSNTGALVTYFSPSISEVHGGVGDREGVPRDDQQDGRAYAKIELLPFFRSERFPGPALAVRDDGRGFDPAFVPESPEHWSAPYYVIIKARLRDAAAESGFKDFRSILGTSGASEFYDAYGPQYCMATRPEDTSVAPTEAPRVEAGRSSVPRPAGEFSVDVYVLEGKVDCTQSLAPEGTDTRKFAVEDFNAIRPVASHPILCSRDDQSLFAVPIREPKITGVEPGVATQRHPFGLRINMPGPGRSMNWIPVCPGKTDAYTVIRVNR